MKNGTENQWKMGAMTPISASGSFRVLISSLAKISNFQNGSLLDTSEHTKGSMNQCKVRGTAYYAFNPTMKESVLPVDWIGTHLTFLFTQHWDLDWLIKEALEIYCAFPLTLH